LVNTRGADGLLTSAGTQILRFDIDCYATSAPSRVPDVLRELPPINLAEVVRTRRFEFDKENEVWTVNGKIFNMENSTATPSR
jgi:hypothetical protein